MKIHPLKEVPIRLTPDGTPLSQMDISKGLVSEADIPPEYRDEVRRFMRGRQCRMVDGITHYYGADWSQFLLRWEYGDEPEEDDG